MPNCCSRLAKCISLDLWGPPTSASLQDRPLPALHNPFLQCGRFQPIEDFDESKRTCRRKVGGNTVAYCNALVPLIKTSACVFSSCRTPPRLRGRMTGWLGRMTILAKYSCSIR